MIKTRFGAISFGPTVSIPALVVVAGIGYLLLQVL
jgi:hypothetical protein